MQNTLEQRPSKEPSSADLVLFRLQKFYQNVGGFGEFSNNSTIAELLLLTQIFNIEVFLLNAS